MTKTDILLEQIMQKIDLDLRHTAYVLDVSTQQLYKIKKAIAEGKKPMERTILRYARKLGLD